MPPSPQERAIAHVASLSAGDPADASLRVTINFHPDRLAGETTVLGAMGRDGLYRSQFETRTSNGALTAHPGGSRWLWESRIFGGAYDDEAPSARPKYGALNFRGWSHGGSPRFGSAHLRLRREVLERTTFCYPDSVFDPTCFGVSSRCSTVLDRATATRVSELLDDYVEAQVHGAISLERDVEALVLDVCYRGTMTEREADALRCPIEWHRGFRLSVEELQRHPDYRGPEYVELGLALARDGHLDPRIIGDAARTGRYDPQALKRLWHYVARFGASESYDGVCRADPPAE